MQKDFCFEKSSRKSLLGSCKQTDDVLFTNEKEKTKFLRMTFYFCSSFIYIMIHCIHADDIC
jgi:hypothetical protein